MTLPTRQVVKDFEWGWLLVSGGTAGGKIAPAIAGLLEVAVAVVGNGYICGGMACDYCCGYVDSRDGL